MASSMVIREGHAGDRAALLELSQRLMIGMAGWRDVDACRAAVQGWVEASLERSADAGTLYVAVTDATEIVGFLSVEASTHFSGEREAYIGELVVAERAEGAGVGRRLVAEAEAWARSHGFRTLTLVTGAANTGARHFYDRLGFLEEEVRLTKVFDLP